MDEQSETEDKTTSNDNEGLDELSLVKLVEGRLRGYNDATDEAEEAAGAENHLSAQPTFPNEEESVEAEADDLDILKLVQLRLSERTHQGGTEDEHQDIAASWISPSQDKSTGNKDDKEDIKASSSDPAPDTDTNIPPDQLKSTRHKDEVLAGKDAPEATNEAPRVATGQARRASLPGAFATAPGFDSAPDSLAGAEQSATTLSRPEQAVVVDEEHGGESGNTQSGLAVANPVEDCDLPLAQELDREEAAELAAAQKNSQTRRLRAIFVSTTSLLVLAGVTTLLVLLFKGGGSSTSSEESDITSSPTQGPTLSLESRVLALFPDYTLRAMELSDSPQSLAFEWLMNDNALSNLSDWRILQRFALVTFYYATDGPGSWFNSTNWLDYNRHECDWFSQGWFDSFGEDPYVPLSYPSPCEEDPTSLDKVGIFKHLWLWGDGLQGTLPLELFWLTSLRSISLYSNNLAGPISPLVGKLLSLEDVMMVANRFTGAIPTEIGLLTNLTGFVVSNNELEGTIPTQLSLLSKLVGLALDANQLSGGIPTELGRLHTVDWMFLDANPLAGTIPSELGTMSSLRHLQIRYNMLTSTFPTELGNLSMMQVMAFEDNALTGSIPSELLNLSQLSWLLLKGNILTGTIMSEFGLLPSLSQFVLFNNSLTGGIPTDIGQLSDSLQVFLVRDNDLSGPIPSELGLLSNLRRIWLERNQLSGTIPLEIGPLGLDDFLVGGNDMLSGTIPSPLCSIGSLDFDCSDLLCGCSCLCLVGNNETISSDTANSSIITTMAP